MVKEERDCSKAMRCIKDALEAVEGKWKLLIIYALCGGAKRFKELSRDVVGISDKILTSELKHLQENKLIKRTRTDEPTITIQYELTAHGRSLNKVLFELWNWGSAHRGEVIGKSIGINQATHVE